jgi:hypothetical protein
MSSILRGFTHQPLPSAGLFSRYMGREPARLVVVRVNNYLASVATASATSREDVVSIIRAAKRDPDKKLPGLIDLYFQFVEKSFTGPIPVREYREALRAVRSALGLNESQEATLIEKNRALSAFRSTLAQILVKGQRTTEDIEFLNQMRMELDVSEADARKMFSETFQMLFKPAVKTVLETGRYSPADQRALLQIGRAFQVEVTFSQETRARLDRARSLWSIENEPLPVLSVPLSLLRYETCFWRADAVWHELREHIAVTTSGGGFGIPIGGIYCQSSSFKTTITTQESLTRLDQGPLYLTNFRLIHLGDRQNRTLFLSNILRVDSYRDGVILQGDSGYHPVLELPRGDVEIFAATLARSLRDSRKLSLGN